MMAKFIRLPQEAYLLLVEFISSRDLSVLRRVGEFLDLRIVAVLLRSWGFERVGDPEVDRLLAVMRPEDSADITLVVEEDGFSLPGAAVYNVLSRETVYMPVGMLFTDAGKWGVFDAVSQFYRSVREYPFYVVEFQYWNWRRFTSFDVNVMGGYAVDLSAEGLAEGCGVAYKEYWPRVFAHELIHCAQQAEGRSASQAAMELEAHAMERVVELFLAGDPAAGRLAELAEGKVGAKIGGITEEEVTRAFAAEGVNVRVLQYVVDGRNLLARPAWANLYRSLGEFPRGFSFSTTSWRRMWPRSRRFSLECWLGFSRRMPTL